MNHFKISLFFGQQNNVDQTLAFMKTFEYTFMKSMKTIVNFVHNLEIEGIVKIHFCHFFTILCIYIRQETFELNAIYIVGKLVKIWPPNFRTTFFGPNWLNKVSILQQDVNAIYTVGKPVKSGPPTFVPLFWWNL